MFKIAGGNCQRSPAPAIDRIPPHWAGGKKKVALGLPLLGRHTMVRALAEALEAGGIIAPERAMQMTAALHASTGARAVAGPTTMAHNIILKAADRKAVVDFLKNDYAVADARSVKSVGASAAAGKSVLSAPAKPRSGAQKSR